MIHSHMLRFSFFSLSFSLSSDCSRRLRTGRPSPRLASAPPVARFSSSSCHTCSMRVLDDSRARPLSTSAR